MNYQAPRRNPNVPTNIFFSVLSFSCPYDLLSLHSALVFVANADVTSNEAGRRDVVADYEV